jgi:hypothetical protein
VRRKEGWRIMQLTGGTLVPVAVALSLWLGPSQARAARGGSVIYVAPGGKVSARGTAKAPLGRVQEALDRARAGDTVRLRPGVYRERVRFTHGGTHRRPVTLEGEPGAVLDGSEAVELLWTPADDIAPGVYRAPLAFFPFTVTAEGKLVTALDERRVDPATQTDPKWQWPFILKNGIGPNRKGDGDITGWEGVKALALYRREAQELLIRFQGDLDPRRLTITVSPPEPVVRITGQSRCVVRGVTLRNAKFGVLIEHSLGSVVERCTIERIDYGVAVDSGADRATVRFNTISMDPYAGADPRTPGAWDNWLAHKEGGFYDRTGIRIRYSRGGHQIHDNLIHDHWDGIEDYVNLDEVTGVYDAAGCDHHLNIHHNRIANCSDDGLEPNGEEANCEWHDNLVERCLCGFRIKAPRVGPLYAYRNIFFDCSEDYRNFGGGETMRPVPVYVYQNTSTSDTGLNHLQVTGVGTPQYHFLNNLFWCRAAFWSSEGSVPPNWQADHNVYVRRQPNRGWPEAKQALLGRGVDQHSRWIEENTPGFVDLAQHDVRLAADSPARRAGADLSKLFEKPLPGCPPGYFSGEAPDAGALQFGEPTPRLPRRPEEVECPPAGAWPGPEADARRRFTAH